MSFVFEDTTYTADRIYEIPIKRFTSDFEIPQVQFRNFHSVKLIFQMVAGGDNLLRYPFVEELHKVNGAVSNGTTVVLDESPT